MKVLILAAGYGTRLYPLVKDTPKALLDINGRALIEHIIDRIKDIYDLTEIVVVTNEKFYTHFTEWAQQQPAEQNITIINDGTKTPDDRLGSIGDIEFVLKNHKVEEDLLVVGGDNLFDYNIKEYIEFARKKSPHVSLGLYDIGDLEQARLFGVVETDENFKVVSFEEKPENPKSSLIAMCFYYLPQSSLTCISEYLTEVGKADRAGDYIRWLTEKNEVYGFKFTGKWYDIGSIEAYKEAQDNFQ